MGCASKIPLNLRHHFYIIVVYFNPCNYESRLSLFQSFAKMMEAQHIKLTIVECAYADQSYRVTKKDDPFHIQLRASTTLWIKENLINIAIKRLPNDWEYVAWIDADVEFKNKKWLTETISALQKYQIVQMFKECELMDRSGTKVIERHFSFFYTYKKAMKEKSPPLDPYCYVQTIEASTKKEYGHPGFAWAATKYAITSLGLLIDWCIVGSADTLMAYSLIGELDYTTIPFKSLEVYAQKLYSWQKNAMKFVNKSVHYVDGVLVHYWHGTRKARNYYDRNYILTNNNFNPNENLIYDTDGLIGFKASGSKLEKELVSYFEERKEDD